MAYIDTLGAANRGLAQGAIDFNTFMQSTANVNQLLSNAQQQELMQQMPIAGLAVPGVNIAQMQAPAAPTVGGKGVGLLPNMGGMDSVGGPVSFDQLSGFRAPAGVSASPGFNPYDTGATKLTGVVPQQGGFQWAMPSKDYYPDQQYLPVNGNQTVLQNLGAKIGNKFLNLPGDIYNLSANIIERPFVNTAQYLTTPENQLGVASGGVSSNIEIAAPAATSPAAGVSAPSPAAGASSSPGGSVGLTEVGTRSGSGVADSNATPSSTEEFFPTEVRNASLKADPSELGYVQEQLLKKRDMITQNVNEQLALFKAQSDRAAALAQGKINQLRGYAQAAQKAGNVGLMTKYLDQADGIMADAANTASSVEQQSLSLQQQARDLYAENDLQLWTQQAMQAEYEFRNMGDPTRMTQIMAAFGVPVAVEDAGGGKYRIVDITGDGQGKRRKGTFTSEEVGDMFMSLVSEQFRQQKIDQQTAAQQKQLDQMFELQKIDATGAKEISVEMAKQAMQAGEYHPPQQDANGNMIMMPKQPGPGRPILKISAEPQTTPQGVSYSSVEKLPY